MWMREFAIPYASGGRIKGTVDEELCVPELDALLKSLGVVRIVVGHMPIPDRVVKSRCGGKLILTDVQISRWMGDGERDQAKPTAVVFAMAVSGKVGSIVAYYSDIDGGNQDTTVLAGVAPVMPAASGARMDPIAMVPVVRPVVPKSAVPAAAPTRIERVWEMLNAPLRSKAVH